MLSKKRLLAAGLMVAGFYATSASATVINDCTISSSNIAFGSYDPTLATGADAGTGSTLAVRVRHIASGTNIEAVLF